MYSIQQYKVCHSVIVGQWIRAAAFPTIVCFVFLHADIADAFALYTVGADAACDYQDVQSAVNAAGANSGGDYVWISSNKTYTNEQISVSNQDVVIEGSFTSCSDFTIGPNDTTTLRGANGGGPVLPIGGSSDARPALC